MENDRRKVVLDTSALMNGCDIDFEKYLPIISTIVLEELDNLKLSENGEKAFKARQAIRYISTNDNKFQYIVNDTVKSELIINSGMDISKNDNKIIDICILENATISSEDKALLIKAKNLGIEIIDFDSKNEEDEYRGYKEIVLTDDQIATLYTSEIVGNKYGLLLNEYLIVKDINGDFVDSFKLTKEGYKSIIKKNLQSMVFGNIKPKDEYQTIAIDSLLNNQFTILTGCGGTAKTLLSLAYIMQSLQGSKIDRFIVCHNPCVSKGTSNLGYYPGDRNMKILSSSLGGILASKFGDTIMIDTLINQGKMMLIPMSDIRGFEASDRSCIYVTEGQNIDDMTMKLLLQRAKDGTKVIIEGDNMGQVDSRYFEGSKNGMRRAIEVFKGEEMFGCVQLKNIYRSKLANIAEKM